MTAVAATRADLEGMEQRLVAALAKLATKEETAKLVEAARTWLAPEQLLQVHRRR